MIVVGNIRVFRGSETKQSSHEGKPSEPGGWYYEPADYEGDVLWSSAFGSYTEAYQAGFDELEVQP